MIDTIKALRELRELAGKATQTGTWFPDAVSSGCRVCCDDPRQTIVAEITGAASNPDAQADARFIAACSPDRLIPLLTAAIEAMEMEERRGAAIERLREAAKAAAS